MPLDGQSRERLEELAHTPEQIAVVDKLTKQPKKAEVSLLWSQTIDLNHPSVRLTDASRAILEKYRPKSGDKVVVQNISRIEEGYVVTLKDNQQLRLTHAELGIGHETSGGGLANFAKNIRPLLQAFNGEGEHLAVDILTWNQSKAEFSTEHGASGRPRTSLVLQNSGEHGEAPFSKLILTEQGPSFDDGVDPQDAEDEFYSEGENFYFVGQEPGDSKKLEKLLRKKQKNPNIKIFWLVGSNQLAKAFSHFEKELPAIDFISLNLKEAREWTSGSPMRNRDRGDTNQRKEAAYRAACKLIKAGVKRVIITDGARGAYAFESRDNKVDMVFSPLSENKIDIGTNIKEDTGCGDSFASAVAAYWMLNPTRFNLQEANRFAHNIAGIVYQLDRPYLTENDLQWIRQAREEAQEANIGNDELRTLPLYASNSAFARNEAIEPKDLRGRVLALLIDGYVGQPHWPDISGIDSGLEHLFGPEAPNSGLIKVIRPLLRHVTRLTPIAEKEIQRYGFHHVDEAEFKARVADTKHGIHPALLADGGKQPSGVLRSDFENPPPGITLLRITVPEALEIISDKRYRDLYQVMKIWQFTHAQPEIILRDHVENRRMNAGERRSANDHRMRDAHANAHKHIMLHETEPEKLAKEAADHLTWLSAKLLQRIYNELLAL